jgi:hypothetical protein
LKADVVVILNCPRLHLFRLKQILFVERAASVVAPLPAQPSSSSITSSFSSASTSKPAFSRTVSIAPGLGQSSLLLMVGTDCGSVFVFDARTLALLHAFWDEIEDSVLT